MVGRTVGISRLMALGGSQGWPDCVLLLLVFEGHCSRYHVQLLCNHLCWSILL